MRQAVGRIVGERDFHFNAVALDGSMNPELLGAQVLTFPAKAPASTLRVVRRPSPESSPMVAFTPIPSPLQYNGLGLAPMANAPVAQDVTSTACLPEGRIPNPADVFFKTRTGFSVLRGKSTPLMGAMPSTEKPS